MRTRKYYYLSTVILLTLSGGLAVIAKTDPGTVGYYQTTNGCHTIAPDLCQHPSAGTNICKYFVTGLGLRTVYTNTTTFTLKKCTNVWKYSL